MLCSSVTCAVHSANRTHHAGHEEFHTRVRVENPSSPNPTPQPGFCPSVGSATSTAGVPGPGFTPAAEHVGVSCIARPGPHARCPANPARSPLQLRPLPGPCFSTVAVVVSVQHTRSNSRVSRDSHTTTLLTGRRGCMLTHAHRHLPYTQRPHTRCSPHTRSLTHSCRLTHTHHTIHTRKGTHPRCLIHTRLLADACRFWRTRGSTHTMLHSLTECWEARTPAHS